jgi:hypothetical protein
MFEQLTDKHMGKMFLGFGVGALLFGVFVVGINMYNLKDNGPKVEKKDKKELFIEDKKKRFLDSFKTTIDYNQNIEKEFYNKESYNSLIEKPDNILETNWKRRFLIENTPVGNIIMFYNAYKQGFSYYCDDQVPYFILNGVAMKYVLKYYCRDFFIDNSVVPKENSSPFLHIHEIDKEKASVNKIDVNKGPFAKLKTYKTDKKHEKKTEISTSQERKKITENFIKNKFICCGKTYLFQPLQSLPRKQEIKNIPISYSSFKQWHNPQRFELLNQ